MREPTQLVEVFGRLRPHPWVPLGSADQLSGDDVHGVLSSLAQSMRWSSMMTTRRMTRPGLPPRPLALIDSGHASEVGKAQGSLIAWSLANVDPAYLAAESVPIELHATMVGQALNRIGELELAGVQAVLPIERAYPDYDLFFEGWLSLHPGQPGTVDASVWSNGRVDRLADQVRSYLDNSPSFAGPPHGGRLFPSIDLTDGEVWWEPSRAPDELGSTQRPAHRITVRVRTAYWDMDLCGRLFALLAEACRLAGLDQSVVISARQAAS